MRVSIDNYSQGPFSLVQGLHWYACLCFLFNELELFVDEKSEKKCATLFEHPDCDGFTIDMERNENINVLDGKRKMVRALLFACLTYFVMLLDDRIFSDIFSIGVPKVRANSIHEGLSRQSKLTTHFIVILQ